MDLLDNKAFGCGLLLVGLEESGIVVLSREGGEKAVSVRNRTTPMNGVIIMIRAGVPLIGGMLRYFIQMMRQPD